MVGAHIFLPKYTITPLKHYFSKKTVAQSHILDIILYFRKILYNTSINKSLNELI